MAAQVERHKADVGPQRQRNTVQVRAVSAPRAAAPRPGLAAPIQRVEIEPVSRAEAARPWRRDVGNGNAEPIGYYRSASGRQSSMQDALLSIS